MRHMYMEDGHHAHYFAWSVAPDGTPNSNGPAPDGEEYFRDGSVPRLPSLR